MAVNASASAAVAALIEKYGNAAVMEFKKVTGKSKGNNAAKKVAKEAIILLVKNNPSVSLKDMTKMLRKAHPDSASADKRKASAWNEFFKTEMPKVKEDMPEASHSECVKEIGRRWRAQKQGAGDATFDFFLGTQAIEESYTTTTKSCSNATGSKRTADKDDASSQPKPKRRVTRSQQSK